MLTAELNERSRRYNTLILQRIASVGQKIIAEQLQTSEATVSRFVGHDLEKVCQVLAVLGLKVVPAEAQCYSPEKIRILLSLARDHLNQLESPEQLTFD